MSNNTERNSSTEMPTMLFFDQTPRLNTDIDTITFQYPGVIGGYFGKFSSSTENYKILLRCVNEPSQVRITSNLAQNRTTSFTHFLTIKWNKISRKFVRIKVYEEDTMKVLLNKKKMEYLSFSINVSFLSTENKPAVYVVKIHTYNTIAELNKKQLQEELEKSDDKLQVVEKELENLSSDINALLQSSSFSDAVITDGENELKVHKLILSARSSVFNKMFQNPMKESQENIIKITDIPFEAVRALVDYMYSGIVKIRDMKMARDLFIIADKYDVESLKEICLSKLKSVNLENVLDNLALANLYGEKSLKDASFKYVAENYSKIRQQEKWDEFKKENKILAVELLSYVLDK